MVRGATGRAANEDTIRTMHRFYLALEFVLLFAGVPLALRQMAPRLPWSLLPVLWLFTAGCLAWLLCDRGFDRRLLWQAPDLVRWLGLGAAIVVPAGVALALATWYFLPGRFLILPRRHPWFWVLIMLLYPILSVYPQGIIYRGFLFQRYAPLFGRGAVLILVSGVAFGFMHVVFHNRVAPLLTLAGGLLFAWVYDRSQSLLIAALIHGALGCAVFTVGLGQFFFHGTQALPQRAVRP